MINTRHVVCQLQSIYTYRLIFAIQMILPDTTIHHNFTRIDWTKNYSIILCEPHNLNNMAFKTLQMYTAITITY
jgi:hypothetical protein